MLHSCRKRDVDDGKDKKDPRDHLVPMHFSRDCATYVVELRDQGEPRAFSRQNKKKRHSPEKNESGLKMEKVVDWPVENEGKWTHYPVPSTIKERKGTREKKTHVEGLFCVTSQDSAGSITSASDENFNC